MGFTTLDRSAIRTLRDTPRTAALAVRIMQAFMLRVNTDQWHNDAWKNAQIDDMRARTADALKGIRQSARAAREHLDKTMPAIRKGAPVAPEKELARQVAAQRSWQRALTLLQSGVADPAELVKRASAAQDFDMLAALRDELPAHIEAQTGNADPVMVRRMHEDVAELLTKIDDAILPTLSDSQQEAIQISREVSRGFPTAMGAVDWCAYCLDHPDDLGSILDWAPGSVLDTEEIVVNGKGEVLEVGA
jgi:hypothetical protein